MIAKVYKYHTNSFLHWIGTHWNWNIDTYLEKSYDCITTTGICNYKILQLELVVGTIQKSKYRCIDMQLYLIKYYSNREHYIHLAS